MRIGVNPTDWVDSELDEKATSLDEIRWYIEGLMDSIKTGVGTDDYDGLYSVLDDWLDTVKSDLSDVQDQIDEQLNNAPRDYGE